MSGIHFNKVAVIGVGLIGGSLAIELRARSMAGTIVGIGRGMANLEDAAKLGVVDSFTRDVAEGVDGADLVVVAVPVMKSKDVVAAAAPNLSQGCIVTDVGSVKAAVIEDIEPLMPQGVSFVPGHPIAGTEHSGAGAAFAGLFKGRRCVLTPTASTDAAALETIRKMWEAVGSDVTIMDACSHDRVFAAVSHLPHVIAYSLVNTVAGMDGNGTDALGYSAGGFRDFTRIASSSPEMWADICAMNRDALTEAIEVFEKVLAGLKRGVKAGDIEGLKAEFTRAKRLRDSLANGGNTGEGE